MLRHRIPVLMFTLALFSAAALCQDMTSQSRTYVTGSSSSVQEGSGFTGQHAGSPLYPSELDRQNKAAVESGNLPEASRIQKEMESYIPPENYSRGSTTGGPECRPIKEPRPPFNPDWYGTDVEVWAGAMSGVLGWRRMAMVMGEDFNLYMAFVTPQISGTSHVYVYRSSNQGSSWSQIGDAFYSGGYFGQVDILAEKRSASIDDSTRIIVYYTYSSTSNMNGAILGLFSCLRTGASPYFINGIMSPASGNRLSYPTCTSDGAYWTTATYVGCVCSEENNSTDVVSSLRFARSTNWGITHTTVSWATGYDDRYPSACYHYASQDSIWVATERHFSTTNYLVRVTVSPWGPTTGFTTWFVPPTGTDKYERPSLSMIQKQGGMRSDSALISVIKNGTSVYHFTYNGGGTWTTDASGGALGNNKAVTYSSATWLSNNQDKFTMIFGDAAGDSIVLRRGHLNFMSSGTIQYKRNQNSFSTSMAPTCLVGVMGSTPYAVLGYPGFGPINIYENSEILPTAVNQNGTEVPASYMLSQNYPNPFNPSTKIDFNLPKSGYVSLILYDMLGREVKVIKDGQLNAGKYTADFDATNIASGIYFYTLRADGFTDTKKLMLIK